MILNRRNFLILAAGIAAGCSSVDENVSASEQKERVVDAGLRIDFSKDGVYSKFRDEGFFIIRRGDTLLALSAICTHRRCKLTALADRSFYCKCHGSTFDPSGHVTKGPAKLNLGVLQTSTDETGRLLVTLPGNSAK